MQLTPKTGTAIAKYDQIEAKKTATTTVLNVTLSIN